MVNVHRHGTVIKTRGHVATPTTPADTGTTTVTAANGMSWTFPGTVVNGTYIDGSPWVYTATTLPMPTLSTPATGTGEGARHGGMINPTFNGLTEQDPVPTSPYSAAMKHGYDGRAYETVNNIEYDETYNAHLSVATLSPGDSLVSSVSYRPTDTRAELITYKVSNLVAINKMACLTVVNYVPETDEFRPPYFGTTKTRWRWSDLNLGLLPDLTPSFDPKGVTSGDFHIDDTSIYFGADDVVTKPVLTRAEEMRVNSLADLQYWIYPLYGGSAASWLKPVLQQQWYNRDSGKDQSRLACYVLHDFADRDVFLKRLVQLAIDAYAIAAGYSGITPFSTGAGFFASPLWLIRFAGLLFDDTDMKAAASMTTGKESYYGDPWPKWGEQQRVYYSSTAYVDYRLPTGYTGDTPLFGDLATVDVSAGQAPNGSTHDYNEVYDACEYVNPDLPYPAYPGILADVYPQINIGVGVRPGTYMQANHYAHMGCFMASIIMSDEAFWGGAVADFDRRWANDCQMWENFGINFDYSDIGSNGFRRDIHGFGGTGNQWMVDLWDDIS